MLLTPLGREHERNWIGSGIRTLADQPYVRVPETALQSIMRPAGRGKEDRGAAKCRVWAMCWRERDRFHCFVAMARRQPQIRRLGARTLAFKPVDRRNYHRD